MHNTSQPFDVVIAGAGPVGLFLACELRLQGVSVVVLEQTATADDPLKRLPFGMRGLSASTLEILDRRGLLDAVADAQRSSEDVRAAAHWMQQARRPAGHFAGMPFFHDRIDASQWPCRLPSAAGTSLLVEMESLETVLAARARDLGVEVRHGIAVEDVGQNDHEVTIHTGEGMVRGRWLVGCDGGRSMVRKAAGFDFVGTAPEFTGYSIDAELDDPETLKPGRTFTSTGMYTYARPGTIAMADFDGGAFHRSRPITIEHVQAVLQRVSGTGVTLAALRHATTWTDRACQATTYRRGRILLAGDAAHIHSPLGGQGLNLGLGDAMNLGWKLAATVRGHAASGLLDSYSDERIPVGKKVLDGSRAQTVLMRPHAGSRALASIVQDLLDTRDGATYFASRVWGLSVRYDLDDDHPLVGRSVPDFDLAHGLKIGALLRQGGGLWLDFDASAPWKGLAHRWRGRVDYVASDARDRLGLGAVLVRPDGIVAWAAQGQPDSQAAIRAASRWFGEPGDPGN